MAVSFRLVNRHLSFLFVIAVSSAAHAQGIINASAGPVNRGMGGASVAAPLDSIGAIYWNPATISGLPANEMAFGTDVLFTNHSVGSSFGPFSGVTEGDPGTVPIPNIGWVYHTAIPEVTLGLGINAVAGFKTNLPADPTNLALAPPPIGLGRVSSEAAFLQVAPVVAFAINEHLSLAAGPTIAAGQVEIEPFVFNSPNANGIYSTGRSTNYAWGGGFQLGAYYVPNDAWSFGSSLRSTTWMDEFEYFGQDAIGLPRTLSANIDLPMIVSTGLAYSGFEGWVLAADFRFFDYANTDGLGDRAGFNSSGALTGLDWSSIFATALGVQRQLSDYVALRAGYGYNQNPIKNSEAFYNIASPLIYEHTLNAGLSLTPTQNLSFNLAGSYLVENTRTGQLVSPVIGPVAGSTFTNTLDAYFVSFGITMRN